MLLSFSKFRGLTSAALATVAGLAFLLDPHPASAIQLTTGDIGSSFTVIFNGQADIRNTLTTVPGLTSKITYTVTGFSFDAGTNVTSLLLTGLLENTSTIASRVSGVAFDTDPDIIQDKNAPPSQLSTVSGVFTNLNILGIYPNGIGTVDLCASNSNGNGCSGNGGVTDGQSGSFVLDLKYLGNISSVSLDNFLVRYQSFNFRGASSGTGTGTPGPLVPNPDPVVPEPSPLFPTLALGLCLGGAMLFRRTV